MNTTAESNAIEFLKKLIKGVFNIDINGFENQQDYYNLFNICITIDTTVKSKLLFILFDTLFIKEGKFRNSIKKEYLKAYDILQKNNPTKEEKEFIIEYLKEEREEFSIILIEKMFPKNIFNLMCFILKINKDFSIFFKCFEIVMENINKYYIPNVNTYFFKKEDTEHLLDEIMDIIEEIYQNEDSDFFSIIYNGQSFIKIKLSEEQKKNYILKKSDKSVKKIKNFIKQKKMQQLIAEKEDKQFIKNNTNEINIINENNKKLINKAENHSIIPNNNKLNNESDISSLKNEMNALKIKNEKLEKDLNIIKAQYENFKAEKKELQNQLISQKETLEKELKETFEKELSIQKEQFLNKLNIQKKQILSLNARINSLENEKALLKENNKKFRDSLIVVKNNEESKINSLNVIIKNKEEEIKLLNKKLNLIQCRGLIKSIIDIIYGFYNKLDYNNDYVNKVNNIKQKLNQSSEENKNLSFFLTELSEFIQEIYENKNRGDALAHPIPLLNDISKIINDYPNVKKFFISLDMDNLIGKLNQYYKIKMLPNKNEIILAREINDLFNIAKEVFTFKLAQLNQ